MASLVEKLRASRKGASVLKLKVLKIRGEDPDILIFVYEGPEDIPVYDEWIKRIGACTRFEPMHGAGKEQLLAYHQILMDSSDPLLDKIFFFVDRDFDIATLPHPHVYELGAYSIENLLCTEEVVDSILRNEFRRSGRIAERRRLRETFKEIVSGFVAHCEPVNLELFVARRLQISVLAKPSRASEIVTINADSVFRAYETVSDIVVLEGKPTPESYQKLRSEFDELPSLLKCRGKYLLSMLRVWLKALEMDLKSQHPLLFEESDSQLPGDPAQLPMSRFASSTPVPPCLVKFIGRLVQC
ncbi:MAG: DUF4435 domain-containing protein [Rhodocyclaceae bacterium]|nr:DUF4435 domain-containing protein [Rhodocyclaceae bacterium]MCA3075700.1 DUF4435 domain-containing protein [Rhodocyclaceae bacterium]MCA3089945.1 DUF4435 domain-containing protein [Rhodocyclaceae bacterium]MCA3093593.1 DUF4435 domain-containing protein [Rhodocyclaceae bacterium]MCA3096410.1 DUF4435 domain-containing protein [Rhodocyclaceae bacterium]